MVKYAPIRYKLVSPKTNTALIIIRFVGFITMSNLEVRRGVGPSNVNDGEHNFSINNPEESSTATLFARIIPPKVSDALRVIIPTFAAANFVWVVSSEEHSDLYGSKTASQIAAQTLYATLAAGLGYVIGTIGNNVYHRFTKTEITSNSKNKGTILLPAVATGVAVWDAVVVHVKSSAGSAISAGVAESAVQFITQQTSKLLAEYCSTSERSLLASNMKRFVSESLATIILNAPSGTIWKLLYDACNKNGFTITETAIIISAVVGCYQSVGIIVDHHVKVWLKKVFEKDDVSAQLLAY